MKLCLAGLSSIRQGTYAILKEIPFVLESFYYIQDYQISLIHSAELFLLDSGAFTFMSNVNTAVDWDEYINKYADFINAHDVKHFFELDIDAVVGYERVKELRRDLEQKTGKQCIPVWHKSRGLDEFKKLAQDYRYIAIGGIVTKEITKAEYPMLKKLCAYARQHGTKVHGLGFSPSDVEDYGFYSCDSTTWSGISRFGSIFEFTGTSIKKGSLKEGRKVDKSKYIEGEVHNIREWIKYQKHLRSL